MAVTYTIPNDWMGSNPIVVDINTSPKKEYYKGETYTLDDNEYALLMDAMAMYPKYAPRPAEQNGNYMTKFTGGQVQTVFEAVDDVAILYVGVLLQDEDGKNIYDDATLPKIEPADNDMGAKLLDNEKARFEYITLYVESDDELVPHKMTVDEFTDAALGMVGAEDAQIYMKGSYAEGKSFSFIFRFDCISDADALAEFKEMIESAPMDVFIHTEVYEEIEVK